MAKNDLLGKGQERMNSLVNDDKTAGTKKRDLSEYNFDVKKEIMTPPGASTMAIPAGTIWLMVSHELVDMSNDNVRKQADIMAYEQARIILDKMLEVNDRLLNDDADIHLYEVLVGDEDNPFTDIINQHKRDIWALKLLSLAASIQLHDIVYPPACRIVDPGSNLTRYSLMDGLRRFLAMRLLGWEHIPILAMNKEQADEFMISMVTNTQREDMDAATKGMVLYEYMQRTGSSQRKTAIHFNMTHKEVRWNLDAHAKNQSPKEEETKPVVIKQILKDVEEGKLIYIGPRKLTKPEIKAFIADIYTD